MYRKHFAPRSDFAEAHEEIGFQYHSVVCADGEPYWTEGVGYEFTLEQASAFASANTPRGWLGMQGNLVRWEQHLYLQQPAYGTSYVIGKIEVERLLAERKRQLGDQFRMKTFMDDFNAAGLIPVSLLRWQLTGVLPDDVKRMLATP